jgi:hypothetical protein
MVVSIFRLNMQFYSQSQPKYMQNTNLNPNPHSVLKTLIPANPNPVLYQCVKVFKYNKSQDNFRWAWWRAPVTELLRGR